MPLKRLRILLRRVPLTVAVPLFVTLPAIVLAGLLVGIAYFSGRYATERLAAQNVSQVHARVHERLGDFVDLPRRVAAVNRALILEGKLPRDDLRAWRELLFDQSQAFDTLSCIEWGDPAGQVVWFARYPGLDHVEFGIKDAETADEVHEYIYAADGTLPDTPAGRYPYDPRQRPWYTAALAADGPTWTKPFGWVHRDGSLVALGMGYTQQVRAGDGTLLGVLDVELTLEQLSHFLRELTLAKTGKVFVVDHAGSLLAASSNAQTVDADLNPVPAASARDPWIATPAALVIAEHGAFEGITEPFEAAATIDAERVLIRVTPFAHPTGLAWYIGTVIPERDFLAEIEAGRRWSILIGSIAVLLALLAGIALALLMTRPILRIVAYARRVGGGDLDHEIRLGGAPELRQLGRELNRMTAGLRDRLRMRQSLALAMEVQKCLLPSDTPIVEGLDIAGHSTYCDETGGDYYDYLDVAGLSRTTAVVAVGDVVGHGVAAAMLMATARGILRSRCEESGSLADLLTHMNTHLARDVGDMTGRFMTMLLMTLDAERRQLRWASAGHDPPLLYDPAADRFIELEGGGLPLGVLAEEQYTEYVHAAVQPHQICFVGTDGVWEAADATGALFGKARVTEVLRAHAHESADAISHALRAALETFRGGVKQADDVTFVILKVK